MRVLAILCAAFAAAVFAGVYLLPFAPLFPLAALLLACGALLLLRKRITLRPIALLCFGAAFGFGWFALHDLMTFLPARLLDGSERTVEARILDYPQVYPEYTRVTVSARTEGILPLHALVYDSSGSLSDAGPGDIYSFTARITPADRRFGEAFDDYNARDLYLKLNVLGECSLLRRGSALSGLPVRLNRALTAHMERVFPADCRAFMKSLLLGNKSELYSQQAEYLALSRAGNMHAMAVSGLHIAFLVGMLQMLFGKQSFSSLLCILAVWVFALVTGGTPSAVRAALMQSLMLLAPVLRRENDPPTTLAFALAVILLPNPRAAASVSLQLSFAAMAGILCFGERLHELFTGFLPDNLFGRLLNLPASALASSLAVLPVTIPLMGVHFGYLSLLSPLTSVLCSLAISLCFCLGYLSCLLMLLYAPLGLWAGWITAWIARYIVWVSVLVSSVPHSVLYLELDWNLPWLIGVYVLFIGVHFLPIPRGLKLLVPSVLAAFSLVFLSNQTKTAYETQGEYFAALNVGQGQCLCALSGQQTVVIDCGNAMSPDNAGELAGRWLLSRGREGIDALILTHLDSDHVNGVSMLMEMLPVKMLILPSGTPEDNAWLPVLRECVKDRETELVFLRSDGTLTAGALSMHLYAPLNRGGGNDGGLFLILHYGSYDVLVTGDASEETENAFLLHAMPRDLELLVVGHHGSRYSSGELLLKSCGAETAVISTGYNTFGHPAQETLDRLLACGYNIYRTDLDGTLEFRIEDGYGKEKHER